MTEDYPTYTAYAKQPPRSGGTSWLITVHQPGQPQISPVLGEPWSYTMPADADPYEALYDPIRAYIIATAGLDDDAQFAISIIITR